MPTIAEENLDFLQDVGNPAQRDKIVQAGGGAKPLDMAIGAITAAVILGVYLLRVDNVVGQIKDDGWYVILAKSLATGHGYNLINLPQHSGLYFYPPLFPFLLSLLYRVSPEFPRNTLLLKSLSIASMLVLPILVFRLLSREYRLPRFLAYLVAFGSAVAPSLILPATSSIMSECVFTTLQFATLLYADRCARQTRNETGGKSALATGVLAAASILTRTIGIALIPAIALDLLRHKIFRPLALFLLAATVCLTPWMVYKHLRMSSTSGPVMPGYSAQFWDRLAGSSQSIKVTPRDLPARVWQMATVLVGDDVGGILAPSLYRSASESGQEILGMTAVIPKVSRNAIGLPGATMGLNVSAQIISLGFSILVLIGFVTEARREIGAIELFFVFTLAMIVVWPWPPIRFLAPLVPLLFYYLLLGIARIQRVCLKRVGRASSSDLWAASRVVMLCLLALLLYDSAGYVVAKSKGIGSPQYPDWVRQFDASKKAGEWVRDHTTKDEVVSGTDPSFVYLFSGRQTAMCALPHCAKMGIRYYVTTGDAEVKVPANFVFEPGYHGVAVLELERK